MRHPNGIRIVDGAGRSSLIIFARQKIERSHSDGIAGGSSG